MATKCQYCGGQIYKDEKFCPNCGKPTADGKKANQPAYPQPYGMQPMYPMMPGMYPYPQMGGGVNLMQPMMQPMYPMMPYGYPMYPQMMQPMYPMMPYGYPAMPYPYEYEDEEEEVEEEEAAPETEETAEEAYAVEETESEEVDVEEEEEEDETGKKKGFNVLALVGFILSIVLPPIGLILSIIALVMSKKYVGRSGKELAIAGIIIGIILTVAAAVCGYFYWGEILKLFGVKAKA